MVSSDPCKMDDSESRRIRVDILLHPSSEESWGQFFNLKSSIAKTFPNTSVLAHTVQTKDNIGEEIGRLSFLTTVPSQLFKAYINCTPSMPIFSKGTIDRYPTQNDVTTTYAICSVLWNLCGLLTG